MREQEIKKTIADYFRLKKCLVVNVRNVGIFNPDTKQYIPLPNGERGVSDLLILTPQGKLIACEVKKPGNYPTKDQKHFLDEVNKHNGIGVVVRNLKDAMEIIP